MNIPLSALQFSGRLVIRKAELEQEPAVVATGEDDSDVPYDPSVMSEDNFVTALGPGWKEGDIDFGDHQRKHFVQAQTTKANDPRADVAAAQKLASKGIGFVYLPTQEKDTMLAADTVSTDFDFVQGRIAKGKPVGFTKNPGHATAPHVLDENA